MADFYIDDNSAGGGDGTTTALTGANAAYTYAEWLATSGYAGTEIFKFKRGQTFSQTARKTIGAVITMTTYYNSDGSDDTSQPRPIVNANINNDAIFYNNGGTLTIENFELTSSRTLNGSTDTENAIEVRENANAATIENCVIHNVRFGIRCTPFNVGTYGEDITIKDCTIYNTYTDGIYGTRCVNIEIDNELHKKAKLNALLQNKTLIEYIHEALTDKIKKDKR